MCIASNTWICTSSTYKNTRHNKFTNCLAPTRVEKQRTLVRVIGCCCCHRQRGHETGGKQANSKEPERGNWRHRSCWLASVCSAAPPASHDPFARPIAGLRQAPAAPKARCNETDCRCLGCGTGSSRPSTVHAFSATAPSANPRSVTMIARLHSRHGADEPHDPKGTWDLMWDSCWARDRFFQQRLCAGIRHCRVHRLVERLQPSTCLNSRRGDHAARVSAQILVAPRIRIAYRQGAPGMTAPLRQCRSMSAAKRLKLSAWLRWLGQTPSIRAELDWRRT